MPRKLSAVFAALVAIAFAPVSAQAYSAIYAFGDSLSDVGNVFTALGGSLPANPYVNGQFSNGPVWVQDLANIAKLSPLTPSILGGTDYAWGDATTGYAGTLEHAQSAADRQSASPAIPERSRQCRAQKRALHVHARRQ